MNPVEIIIKKRDGNTLSHSEIEFFISSYLNKKIPDYQMSAFLMAVFLKGFSAEETFSLTKVMLHSGIVLNLSNIKAVKVDKHSTGGVGDKTSLILAPIVAAAGIPVPMISGRSLGHTGGTLDKLDSIPGFKTRLSLKDFVSILEKTNCCLIGQTEEIAPADKVIYSLRDVTGTVESIPLISASIMSKKLAEGIDALVLDVKTGKGAFMKTFENSETLALKLKEIAEAFGKKTIAMITRMDEPLGYAIGNWLEIVESIECLQGKEVDDLMEVTLNLAGAMIYLGQKASSIEEGITIAKEIIKTGKAFDKFIEIAESQGADITYLKDMKKYQKSRVVIPLYAEQDGFIKSINSYELGMAAIELGAGRMKYDDQIDYKAGILLHKKENDKISEGDLLLEVFTDKDNIDSTIERIKKAYEFSSQPEIKQPMILKILT